MGRLRELKPYIGEVWSELKQTTWPSRREVYGTTLVVIITVLICAAFLWVVDLLLSRMMEAVFEVLG